MEERVNLHVEMDDGRKLELTGVTHVAIVDGHLHLQRVTTTTRTEPVSMFWGLYKSERQVVDEDRKTLGIIASGRWTHNLADGVLVPTPAAAPATTPKAKKAK